MATVSPCLFRRQARDHSHSLSNSEAQVYDILPVPEGDARPSTVCMIFSCRCCNMKMKGRKAFQQITNLADVKVFDVVFSPVPCRLQLVALSLKQTSKRSSRPSLFHSLENKKAGDNVASCTTYTLKSSAYKYRINLRQVAIHTLCFFF